MIYATAYYFCIRHK